MPTPSFFPWGETTVTLEDVERICLLPSIGDVNLLELGLFDEESVITRKLLETFGDTSTSWEVMEPDFLFGFLNLESLRMLIQEKPHFWLYG